MKELNFTEDYISLNIIDDGEGNPLCTIKLDDEQELTITQFELINLKKIMDEHIDEIQDYFYRVENLGFCTECGELLEEGELCHNEDEEIICEDCLMKHLAPTN